MDYKNLYEKVYEYMDVQLVDGDCGKLCNHHCCRTYDGDEKMGIYLMPYEYESILKESDFNKNLKIEKHNSFEYNIPHKVGQLNYIYCEDEFGCFRHLRPIQCRSYPFEPHLENNELYLVIEKDQIHKCPLIEKMDQWREEFIKGIYAGWSELIKINKVKYMIEYDSKERLFDNNIKIKLSKEDIKK